MTDVEAEEDVLREDHSLPKGKAGAQITPAAELKGRPQDTLTVSLFLSSYAPLLYPPI